MKYNAKEELSIMNGMNKKAHIPTFLDNQDVSKNVIMHVATAQFLLHFYWDFTDKGKDT